MRLHWPFGGDKIETGCRKSRTRGSSVRWSLGDVGHNGY